MNSVWEVGWSNGKSIGFWVGQSWTGFQFHHCALLDKLKKWSWADIGDMHRKPCHSDSHHFRTSVHMPAIVCFMCVIWCLSSALLWGHSRREKSRKMAQSSQGCEKGPDIGRDPKFSHPHAFAQMVFALRNSFSTWKYPTCASRLYLHGTLSVWQLLVHPQWGGYLPCSHSTCPWWFIVTGHAVMVSVAHIPHLP